MWKKVELKEYTICMREKSVISVEKRNVNVKTDYSSPYNNICTICHLPMSGGPHRKTPAHVKCERLLKRKEIALTAKERLVKMKLNEVKGKLNLENKNMRASKT